MQISNWSDLRYLLALQRGRTLAAAARRLGVDDTTVSRRLAALQAAVGRRLCERQADGTFAFTVAGEVVARQAEIIEHHVGLIGSGLAETPDCCAGTVRLTSVPMIVNRLLVPGLPAVLAAHPALHLELIPAGRDFSLSRREADLALRLARPRSGGTGIKTRRVACLAYGVYASRRLASPEAAGLPWISYDEARAHLPQARWMARRSRKRDESVSQLKVHDVESAWQAAIAGLGRTLLPRVLAKDDQGLQELDLGEAPCIRELWLLGHADQLGSARIAAVVAWIDDLVARSLVV